MLRPTLLALMVSLFTTGCCCPRPCAEDGATRARETGADETGADATEVLLELVSVRIPAESADATLAVDASTRHRVLTAAEAQALLTSWGGPGGAQVLQAPSLVTRIGDEASLAIGQEPQADAGQGAPFIGYAARIGVERAGEALRVEFHETTRQLAPAEAKPRSTAATTEQYLHATFTMPDGGYALLRGADVLEDAEGPFVRVALLHVIVLVPEP
ncbi:MAG: hypothetical protein O2894_03445 [Planctomycetota bacterium]|nr:hypothetical protein [Planctomycetota bacterium]